MDTSNYHDICSDLSSFCEFVFEDCPGVPLTNNLESCLEARLIESSRKTHQPAAKKLVQESDNASALRQRINRATLSSRWTDQMVRSRLYDIAKHNIVEPAAWIIDDTGIIKKGDKSPGVQRQYCGKAGKTENCQIVVSTHISGWNSSQPLEADLYLPESWAGDFPRRREADIPEDIDFRTKPDIALEQLDRLLEGDCPKQPVLADSAYGNSSNFRKGLRDRDLDYAVAVKNNTQIWSSEAGAEPSASMSVKAFASTLPESAFETFNLHRGRRESTDVTAAVRRIRASEDGQQEWLVIVWPDNKKSPTDYFLSNLSRDTSQKRLIGLCHLRWRVERDYQDMKQETGFEHYEGRSWPGFHHHLTICMAAHAFLASQRKLFPPQTA